MNGPRDKNSGMPSAVGDAGFTFASAVFGLLRVHDPIGVSAAQLKTDLGLEAMKAGSFDSKMRRAIQILAEQGIATEWIEPDDRRRGRILRLVDQPARRVTLSPEATQTRRLVAENLARLGVIDNASNVLLYLKGTMRRERIRFRYPGVPHPIVGHAYTTVTGPHGRNIAVVVTDEGVYGYDPAAMHALQVIERHTLTEHPDLSDVEYVPPAEPTAPGPTLAAGRGRPTKQRERALAQAAARLLRQHHYTHQPALPLGDLAADIGATTATPESMMRTVTAAQAILAPDGIDIHVEDDDTITIQAGEPSRQVELDAGDALLARTELRAIRFVGPHVRNDFGIHITDDALNAYAAELDDFLDFLNPEDDPVHDSAEQVFAAMLDRTPVEVTHHGQRILLQPNQARLVNGEWRIVGHAASAPDEWALAELTNALPAEPD